jgi:hypothetical protein
MLFIERGFMKTGRIYDMAPTLSPCEAYITSQVQKERSAERFQQEIEDLYRSAKAGIEPPPIEGVDRETQLIATVKFVAYADERTRGTEKATWGDIRKAYRRVVTEFGLHQVEPGPGFEKGLNTFYTNYQDNFRIKEEQESRQGFRDTAGKPMRENGYSEQIYNIICPMTGKYLAGTNFAIMPTSNQIWFIYGFVNPEARNIVGASHTILDLMSQDGIQRAELYPSQYKGKPGRLFEKNDLGDMTLKEIMMDSCCIDITKPPKAGDYLSHSAAGQSMRDLVWSHLGGKIIDFHYLQPSLEGVTIIEDPKEEELVIDYLHGKLSEEAQKKKAETILEKALNGKDPGCTTLNLCIFSPEESIDSEQSLNSIRTFSGISIIKDEENIDKDIYFKALEASLKENSKDGKIALRDIVPYGEAQNFHEAEKITKILLNHMTWKELQEHADRPYSEWIAEKMGAIQSELQRDEAMDKATQSLRKVDIIQDITANTAGRLSVGSNGQRTATQLEHLVRAREEVSELRGYHKQAREDGLNVASKKVNGIVRQIACELNEAGAGFAALDLCGERSEAQIHELVNRLQIQAMPGLIPTVPPVGRTRRCVNDGVSDDI